VEIRASFIPIALQKHHIQQVALGGPVLKLAKIKFAPNAIFRVVSCLCILCDLTCLIVEKFHPQP
jgi:hypothetical protein